MDTENNEIAILILPNYIRRELKMLGEVGGTLKRREWQSFRNENEERGETFRLREF